jgi:hypothetical protein
VIGAARNALCETTLFHYDRVIHYGCVMMRRAARVDRCVTTEVHKRCTELHKRRDYHRHHLRLHGSNTRSGMQMVPRNFARATVRIRLARGGSSRVTTMRPANDDPALDDVWAQ